MQNHKKVVALMPQENRETDAGTFYFLASSMCHHLCSHEGVRRKPLFHKGPSQSLAAGNLLPPGFVSPVTHDRDT
jgi:hypothetical protein